MSEAAPPTIDAAAILQAGFLIVDQSMLHSVMQAAILDARAEGRLQREVADLSDESARQQIADLQARAHRAESRLAAQRVWWRRWLVPLAVFVIAVGLVALATTAYLISEAKAAIASNAEAVHATTTTEMTQIATTIVRDAVAASELRTDAKINDVGNRVDAVRSELKVEIHEEFQALREDLRRDFGRQQAR